MGKKRHIIILNGTACSGKSTTAKALQAIMDEPAIHVDYDVLVGMLPGGHFDTETHEEFRTRAAQLLFAANRVVAGLAEGGYDVIVDCVLPRWDVLHDSIERFKNFAVLFVGIHCPLSVVEQRARERGDRHIGRAQKQIEWVHRHGMYDLELDTGQRSPEECALLIKVAMTRPPQPSAFERLAERFEKGEIVHTFFIEES